MCNSNPEPLFSHLGRDENPLDKLIFIVVELFIPNIARAISLPESSPRSLISIPHTTSRSLSSKQGYSLRSPLSQELAQSPLTASSLRLPSEAQYSLLEMPLLARSVSVYS
jgi:hypothetical protein